MLSETEYLLVTLAEECCEVTQRVSKAIRFGISEIQPGQTEDNRRRIKRELGDLMGVAKMLGLRVHEEDVAAKIGKVGKFMDYSREIGTLEPRRQVFGTCRHCGRGVPSGFYECSGGGSHPAVEASKR